MRRKSLAMGRLVLALLLPLQFAAQPAATAAAAAAARPNIVFVLTDDQAMDQLRTMPFLSSMPHGNWVTFSNAFENVPFCCPSRATILTGQYAHHHGINGSNGAALDDTSTVATWLSAAGYRTGMIGKYLNGYPFPAKPVNYIPPGWDYWAVFNRVDHYDYVLNENGTNKSYGSEPEDYSTDVLYRRALDFLDSTPTRRPFFLYFSTHAPHHVNTPAPRHEGRYASLPIPHGPNFNEADVTDKPAWVRRLPLRSEASITDLQRDAAETLLAVDEAVSGIMAKLVERGQLDNTVIVFMTDNGFSFGAHRWIQKQCAYEECVRTPLLVRYPGVGADRTEARLVSSVDIAPTLAELARAVPRSRLDGRSLLPLLTNDATTWRTSVLLAYQGPVASGDLPRFWAVRTMEWKYIELETGERELYDLTKDPHELANVVTHPRHRSEVSSLAAELDRLRAP